MDEVSAAVKMNSCFIHKDERMQVKIQELTDYFENGQWLQDYDCDARGKLPADLKRGVLSQDALYELLCELENER